jgi:hypothetical protein
MGVSKIDNVAGNGGGKTYPAASGPLTVSIDIRYQL